MAILVAYDGSDPAQKALEHAVTEHRDKEIILLRVIEVAGGSTTAGIHLAQEKLKERRDEVSRELSEEVKSLLEEEDVDFQTETVIGQPSREIVAFVEENDVEHVIMGSHDREGVSRVLLGSVAEKVVRRAPVPVTVVR